MNNKVLVHLLLPEIDDSFDVFVPINIRIGTVVNLINKSIKELSGGICDEKKGRKLYNIEDSNIYPSNLLVRETNIGNGTTVVFM